MEKRENLEIKVRWKHGRKNPDKVEGITWKNGRIGRQPGEVGGRIGNWGLGEKNWEEQLEKVGGKDENLETREPFDSTQKLGEETSTMNKQN